MARNGNDIIIIGAGIIGSSIAYRLAREGMNVTVIEKGRPGREATHAAAGMLAIQSEAVHGVSGPLAALGAASHRLYPNYIADLEEATGIKIGFRTAGGIFVATDFVEAELLAGLLEREQAAGRVAEELSAAEVEELAPALGDIVQLGLYLPQDHQVDPRPLMRALIQASLARGVRFLCSTPVIGLELADHGVIGVRLPERSLSADLVINAAGSWAGLIDPTDRVWLPVKPVRGQIVCLDLQPQPFSQIIHSAECYLVPWPDGRLLVGSTMENVGYNKEVTAHGVRHLLNAVLKIAPSLASAPIRDTWAGLRPGTPDNLPILGPSRIPNLIMATGHFRNGILLAPITAQLISELILTGQSSISLDPFSPSRFDE